MITKDYHSLSITECKRVGRRVQEGVWGRGQRTKVIGVGGKREGI